MSISSEVRRAGPYTGNGSTVAFAFSFKVFATSQVRVTRTTSGTEAVLTLTTDYSVSLNANQNTNPGGTVTMVTAPTTAQTVTITSNVANLQPTAIANLGGFYPEVINDSLDRATIQIQQLDERLDRALVIPVSSSGIDTELPAPESSKLIGWDSAGTGLVNYSNIPVGSTTYQYVHRTIATTGQTAFALPITYTVGASALTVYVNGLRVEQGAGLDYLETNNTTITFTSGLAAGDLVVVAIHGDIDAAATPPNYTVESIAALRLLTTATAATQLLLLYNYVAGDGGGAFRYDSTDTTTADNGGTVIVDAAGRRWKRQWSGAVNVKWFGARGDGTTNDTNAIQAALNFAQSLATTGNTRGVIVQVPPGIYQVASTLTISQSRIALAGAGRYRTIIRRNTAYGNTLTVQGSGLLEQMDISGITFLHDISTGVAMLGFHVVWYDVHQGRIQDVVIENGQYGVGIYGGVDTVLDQVIFIGRNSATAGENGAIGLLLDTAPGGGVVLPTQIRGHSVRVFGPRVAGWNVGLQINACEDVSFESSYFGNQKTHNVFLNQTSNKILLETVFGPGCYFDGAGNHSVILSGASGDGSVYIGNTKFVGCSFKGQGGDGNNGLFVDGTVRSGAYPQATRGVIVDSCTVSGFSTNGIWVVGGNNITISDCQIGGNNYFNTGGGRGILIGAAVDGVTVSNCRIGRNPEYSNVASYQTYGIETVSGALNVVLVGNDVRLNATGGILDNMAVAATSGKRIINNAGFNDNRTPSSPSVPASTVAYFNPFGSPAYVSIFSGTVSDIALNGQTIYSASGVAFPVGPGDRITLTYTVAPSWIWWPF